MLGSDPKLLGRSMIIFFTNLGLCIILMCPGGIPIFWANQKLFFHTPRYVHCLYIPGSYPELLGLSKFIFFKNLGLCIILVCLHRLPSYWASPNLFSLPTSAYALYLCARLLLTFPSVELMFQYLMGTWRKFSPGHQQPSMWSHAIIPSLPSPARPSRPSPLLSTQQARILRHPEPFPSSFL